jgi:hypothetical protein
MPIDWNIPSPLKGLLGDMDRFLGPGTTFVEFALEFTVALLGMAGVVGYAYFMHLGWNRLQYIVAALFAFDIAGGVVTNAVSAGKRWYHRPGQGPVQQLGFTAIHIHPFIISWLFLGMDWSYGLIVYGYLIIATLAILLVPQYLQRPVALAIYGGGLLVAIYLLPAIPGLEWFVPFFYLKLLVSHLVKEEPYRP